MSTFDLFSLFYVQQIEKNFSHVVVVVICFCPEADKMTTSNSDNNRNKKTYPWHTFYYHFIKSKKFGIETRTPTEKWKAQQTNHKTFRKQNDRMKHKQTVKQTSISKKKKSFSFNYVIPYIFISGVRPFNFVVPCTDWVGFRSIFGCLFRLNW